MLRVRSTTLRFLLRPGRPALAVIDPTLPTGYARCAADKFEIEATVDIHADSGDTGHGARLGWTQVQWIETNRGLYRGLTRDDGSVRELRDRAPARPAQACRDSNSSSDPFPFPPGATGLAGWDTVPGYTTHNPLNINLGTISFPTPPLKVSHVDYPGEVYNLQCINGLTNRINYLAWVQIEFHFCSVLVLRRANGSVEQLKHMYWNVHWQADFEAHRLHGGQTVVRHVGGNARNTVNMGRFIDGAANDRRFAGLITPPIAATCNDVAGHARDHPILQEKKRW